MGESPLRTMAALLLLAALNQAAGASPRPNIILITIDTCRPDHFGYHGYPKDTSPSLDAFSREGVYFKQAFTTSGWTSPGIISILSSLYAPSHGVDLRARSLDPGVTTLPEALIQIGYRAPDVFFLTEIPDFGNLGLQPYAKRAQYLSQGDEILFKWLEEEGRNGGPFFLYYHYRDLHLPYDAGEPYDSMFLPQEYAPGFSLLGSVSRFLVREKMDLVRKSVMLVRGVLDFGPSDKPWVDGLYDAQIRRMDTDLFGRLRSALQELRLDCNTLVVISADHGEELLEHGLIGHVSTFKEPHLYDEIIRIPLIFWFPGVLPAGRVVEEQVQCIDVLPSILELAGAPAPAGAQGQSLVPLLQDQPGWRPRPVYIETTAGGFTADSLQYTQRLRVARTARWKLFYATPEERYTLVDLAADPQELEDVQEEYPAVADSLRQLLGEWVVSTRIRGYRQTAAGGQAAGGAPAAQEQGPALPVAGQVAGRVPGPPAGPPEILVPGAGDTLRYQGANLSIQLRWTGEQQAAYVIEYEVGEGAYHLAGTLAETSSSPGYGPFQARMWNSLALYNPWKFRVWRPAQPEQKSAWVAFILAPVAGAEEGLSLAGLLAAAAAAVRDGAQQGRNLVWGLGRGLVDLYLWAAQVPAADLSAGALLLAIAGALFWPGLSRIGRARCRAWALALLYIAFVYATIPVMPAVWDALRDYTEGTVRYLGVVALAAAGAALLLQAWRRVGGRSWKPYAALALIAPAYVYLLREHAVYPSERLHLMEYGLVSCLLFRALRLDLREGSAYIVGLLLTTLVGFGDESIQWVLPQRFFELKDVQLNAVSGALGLLLVRFVFRPVVPAREAEP